MQHENDLGLLNAALRDDFGDGSEAQRPGGYPGEIEAALIDAIFSIRARYGATELTGVRRVVADWRVSQAPRRLDDLTMLARPSGTNLADVTRNNSKTAGRLKADVVQTVAARLVAVGVRHAHDLSDPARFRAAKAEYLRTRGVGPITWSYLSMLLGFSDVKADTHVVRYVSRAVGSTQGLTSDYVRDLLLEATHPFDDLVALDHTIWRFERSRATSRRQRPSGSERELQP